jgi:hypothetical protein
MLSLDKHSDSLLTSQKHFVGSFFVLFMVVILTGCGSGSIKMTSGNPTSTTAQTPIVVTASAQTAQVNTIVTFTALQGGSPAAGGQWVVIGGAGSGSINASGLFLAPLIVPIPSTVVVDYILAGQVYATSVVITASATQPIIKASKATINLNEDDFFTFTQQGISVAGGTWSVVGGAINGSITQDGYYLAPPAVPTPNTVAIHYLLNGLVYSGSVTVINPILQPIVVSGSASSVLLNGTDQMNASVQGSASTGGQWLVIGDPSNGTINQSGLYQAPSTMPSSSVITLDYVLGVYAYSASITLLLPGDVNIAQPTLLSLTPASINSLSTAIVVTGTNFIASSSILINGVPQETLYIDSSHLRCVFTLASPSNNTLVLSVTNGSGGGLSSNSLTLPTMFPALTIVPAIIAPGAVTLSITGSGFDPGDIVFLGSIPLRTRVVSSTVITATGFLKPWIAGAIMLTVASGDGTSTLASLMVPIEATPVTFDAAARFSTQAAFGPRPDLVLHIQQVGFNNFITEQFAQPAYDYTTLTFQKAVAVGNSLLRQRIATALESFIVVKNISFYPSAHLMEQTIEQDANGNYRHLLDDVLSNPDLPEFLNLVNNLASTNPMAQPNQNFARELMQLFTIGPVMLNDDGSTQLDASGSPIPAYGQDTVISVTRALTGWVYAPAHNPVTTDPWGTDYSLPLEADSDSWAHDYGAKLLFGAVILPAGQDAPTDRTMVLDALFNHPNLPPFVSLRLIQQLVSSNPSPAYIQRISSIFKDDGHGVRGNLDAVVRAILLDPEARRGDIGIQQTDGALQDPWRFEMFVISALQHGGGDGQSEYLPGDLGEPWWNSLTIFGNLSPSYQIPGTNITSPEFAMFNNVLLVQRSQALWGMITSQTAGFGDDYTATSWLFNTFTTAPDMVEALNHLVYHGQMDTATQSIINSYCAALDPFDVRLQLLSAVFLALNGDSYNVAQ